MECSGSLAFGTQKCSAQAHPALRNENQAGQGSCRKALRVIRDRETLPPTPAVLEAAVFFNVSAYDAEYLVVARQLGVPLLTFDQKLQQAAQGLAIAPNAFASS
jgi:predicted nucleic acid-binding protein